MHIVYVCIQITTGVMAGADLEFLGRGFFADLQKRLRWRGSFHVTRLNHPEWCMSCGSGS